MPIIPFEAPEASLNVLEEHVAAIAGSGAPHVDFLKADVVDDLHHALPHPLYVVSTDDIRQGRLLAAAKLTGIRRLFVSGENVVAAGVVIGKDDGTFEFDSLTQGRLVARGVDSIQVAEDSDLVKGADVELRYLEVRPLYFSAIWLHAAGEDAIIPLEDHDDGEVAAHSLQSEEAILKLLQDKAERILSNYVHPSQQE